MNLIKTTFLLLMLLTLVACKKDKIVENASSDQLKNGMLVLNEGLMNLNNATVAWVNLTNDEVTPDFFTQQTGRNLGDTGNDMQRYGGKIYVVVNVSSTIEVLSAYDFKPIKQISMLNGGVNKQPRFIEFHNGKAFISCFDGYVDVLDTVSLAIEQRIKVGKNPDQLVRVGDQLFVSNSGGLNTPTMDSTVSVIDLNALEEVKKITVGMNPGSIVASNGKVYVVARGNYYDVPSRMRRIDVASLTRDQDYNSDVSRIFNFKDQLLLIQQTSSTSPVSVTLFDPISNLVQQENFLNTSGIQTFFGLDYRASTQQFYVRDAEAYTNTGYVHVFNEQGIFSKKYKVGLNPTAILFYD